MLIKPTMFLDCYQHRFIPNCGLLLFCFGRCTHSF